LFDKSQNLSLDPLVRQALILSLGQYDVARIPNAELSMWVRLLERIYRTDKHPGVHSAAEWLMREWKQDQGLAAIDAELRTKDREVSRDGVKPADGRLWYLTTHGHTMVIVPTPGEFWVAEGETRHKRVLTRNYAIASKEVTVEQFLRYREKHVFFKDWAPDRQCPVINVSWYDAAAYCNWLSEQEGIPKDQWCYEPNKAGEYAAGMKIAPDAVSRRGYRLATDVEWEHACRAGSATRFFFGDAEALTGRYAWHNFNADSRSHPVGLLAPNDWGLFDTHGNAWEWCQGAMVLDSRGEGAPSLKEQPDVVTVQNSEPRPLRGGHYDSPYVNIRSADASWLPAEGQLITPERTVEFRSFTGFRIARTIP
jgi:formylglycine-generating enzyme required for sulfatase activity